MPTSGFYSSFKQSLPLIGDAKTIKNTYQLSSYYTLSDEVIGAIKFYAQNINGISEDVRLSKRLTLPSNKDKMFFLPFNKGGIVANTKTKFKGHF